MSHKIALTLRLITAALLAGAAARFVGHFELIRFTGAAALTFLFLFTGYLFLSKKYEPVMHALFLSIALVVAYKAVRIKAPIPTANQREQTALNRLFVVAARLKHDKLTTGHYPKSLADIGLEGTEPDRRNETNEIVIEYCPAPCDWKTPRTSSPHEGFWLRARPKNARDKLGTVWYINDAFRVYHLSESDSDFVPYPSEKV